MKNIAFFFLVYVLACDVLAYNNTYVNSKDNITGTDFVARIQDTFAETTLVNMGGRGGTFGGYVVVLIFLTLIYYLIKVFRVFT